MRKSTILRQKKKKLDASKHTDDLKSQKDLLDKSSDVNRNQGLFLVGFMLYILITTASVTDLQLVFWNEANDKGGIAIPFITAFTLPVSSFAWVVPILVLGLHLNLLLHLREHNIKLGKWIACLTEKSTDLAITQQLQPFLFNYTRAGKKGFVVGITRVLVNFAVFFLPMITLFYVEYRFADMHDRVLTTWHFVFLLADACLVQYFYTQIVEPDKKEKWWKNPESYLVMCYRLPRLFILFIILTLQKYYRYYGNVRRKHLSVIYSSWRVLRKWFAKTFLRLLPFLKRRQWKRFKTHFSQQFSIVRFWDKAFYRAALYCSMLYLFLVYVITSPHHYKACVAWERGDDISVVGKLLWGDSTFYNDYRSSFVPGQSTIRWKFSLMPIIDVHGEKLVQSTPDEKEILMAEQNGHNKDTFVLDNTKGIHIDNRDFTMANFSGCNMIKVIGDSLIAPYSNWRRCNANQAEMQKVDLDYADMEHINLDSVWMEGSSLKYSRLEIASLRKRAYLDGVQMQGADFEAAEMQGATLEEAQMQRTYLGYTQMQGANFEDAQMQGAELIDAQMQGANFEDAQMQCAELIDAQMQGADLDSAKMQGVDLSGSQMQGANLKNSQMGGAILNEANLYQVANWNPDTTNILYVNLRNADLLAADINDLDSILHKYSPFDWDKGEFKQLMGEPNENGIFLKTMDEKYILPPVDRFASTRAGLLNNKYIPLWHLFLHSSNSYRIDSNYIAKHNQILRNAIIQQKLSWRIKEFNELAGSGVYTGLTKITDKELKKP